MRKLALAAALAAAGVSVAGCATQPYGYSPYGYTNAYSNAHIVGINRVEQRNSTTLRVRGYASSGMNYGPYAYGAYGASGYGAANVPDLSFKCDVDYRGYVRNVDINRR